jgi:hypothetical protein
VSLGRQVACSSLNVSSASITAATSPPAACRDCSRSGWNARNAFLYAAASCVRGFGWEMMAHFHDARISLDMIVACTEGYTYDASVSDLPIVSRPISVAAPCQTLEYDSQLFHRCTARGLRKGGERAGSACMGDRRCAGQRGRAGLRVGEYRCGLGVG